MRNDRNKTLALALGFGAVSGMRSMAGPAYVSRHLSAQSRRRSNSAVVSLLGWRGVSSIITMMLAGEMAADKLPQIPDRTDPVPLFGRAALGALSGYTVSDYLGGNRFAGALAGAASAVGSTFLFHRLRKEVSERTNIPYWIGACLEDALVLAGGSSLARRID